MTAERKELIPQPFKSEMKVEVGNGGDSPDGGPTKEAHPTALLTPRDTLDER